MAQIVLFHHAMGLTQGIIAFGDRLRENGHVVHSPDLFEGRTFDTLEEGVAHIGQLGVEEIIKRGEAAADEFPRATVFAGFSLGVLPAQKLAQTRTDAAGALLFSACVPPDMLGSPWPAALPAQIHGMDSDPYFVQDGDLEAARNLVSSTEKTELYLYSGNEHLFADNSLPSFDADVTERLLERVLFFLGRVF